MNKKYEAHYILTDLYIELYFDEFPDDLIRETMKICGWSYYVKKKCWSNKKTNENIEFADSICKKEEVEELSDIDRYYFETDSFVLIRNNGFICNSKHSLIDVMGGFWVVNKLGTINMHWAPLAFCEECGLYFMLNETYVELKRKGVILCQMMTTKQYEVNGIYDENFDVWRDIGPLKLWGYSVSKEDGLSESQRRIILEDIIDYGAMTKHMVLSYLDRFIRINGSSKPEASSKWQADRKYIACYESKGRRVIFN